ncbi:MAG: tetratricopeptide repeat protein [Firmicutes bacterium]|nr:tetratricopeptide repeat protein [Bacillota bacterium]
MSSKPLQKQLKRKKDTVFLTSAFFLAALILIFVLSPPAHSQSTDQTVTMMNEAYQLYYDGKFSEAVKKFEECFKIYEKSNNKAGMGETLGNIGMLYYYLSDYRKSLDYSQKSLNIYTELGDKKRIGIVLSNIGLAYSSFGDYQKALDYYQKALNIALETGDKNGIGVAYTNIGVAYISLGDYLKALDYHQKALKIFEELNDKSGAGKSLNNIGLVYESLGEYQKALDYYQQSLKIYNEIGNKLDVRSVLNNMGTINYSLGNYQQALDYFQQVIKLDEDFEDKNGVGDDLLNIGYIYFSSGDYAKALDYFQKALKIKEETGDKSGVESDFTSIGLVHYSLGDYRKSLDYHQKALNIALQIGNKSGAANCFTNIGVVYRSLGDYQKALYFYQNALKIFEDTGDKDGIGSALNNMGSVYYYLSDYEKALDYYQRALKIEEEIGNKKGIMVNLSALGVIYYSLGDDRKALDYQQKALKIAEETGNRNVTGDALNNIGLVYDHLGEHQKALDQYMRAFKIYEEIGDRSGMGSASDNIGLLYYLLGDYAKSLDYYQKALKIYEEIGDADGTCKSLSGVGLSYKGLKKADEAIDILSRAVKALEEIRGKLKVEEQKTSFMQNKLILYEELIELLLQKGRDEDAWEYTERAKARTFLDMLGNQKIDFKAGASLDIMNKEEELSQEITAAMSDIQKENNTENAEKLRLHLKELKKEYEDTLEKLKISNPEYASFKTVEVSSLKEIQKNLDAGTLLLEYFTGLKKSYLFIVDKSSIKVVEIPENENQLEEKISEVLKRVAGKAPLKEELTSLSNILIKPAWESMKGKSKLIIIPHSSLHYLPFAMLVDSKGDYLIENFQILTQPSASVWLLCIKKPKEKGEKLAAYAIGDISISFGGKTKSQKAVSVRGTPVMSDEILRGGLPPLPGTKEEVEEIARIYAGGKIFVGKKATIEDVKKNAAKGTLVHFATHGILDSSYPLFSGLVFSDGILTTSDIFGLDLKANLVVLSACNTAGGRISNGDEIVGISRAFMYAGTPTVIATLWSIADVSTAELMQDFYKRLKQGKSKGAALQEAQKDMLKNSEYSHPYYWAPFLLIGDGGDIK